MMKKNAEILSTGLWVVILIIIGVSAMSSIRWVSPSLHMTSDFGPSRDLSHALILGLGILLTGFINLSYHHINSTKPLNICFKMSLILLIIGIVISSAVASDKAAAFYTGGGLLIGLILMSVTRRLADKPWKLQLSLVLIVSLGVTFAAKAWVRELWEFDEGWKHYVETREEFWGKQGKSLDDPTVKMFEARMLSRDNGGFFFHGNLGGMWLATVWLVSLGLLGKRWRERNTKYGVAWVVTAGLMSGFILSALILTQSKGAIAAAGIGVILIGVVWGFKGWLRRNFRTAVMGAVLLVGLAGVAVVGYGLAKKTLPTLSMAYRWQYWVASYEMFKDHWFAGVGSGNYGHYYQKYKLPEAEEEITSPHNFIVQGFTQFGVIGGIGFLLLPAGILYEAAKRSRDKEWAKISEKAQPGGPSASIMMLGLWVGIFGVLFLFNQAGQRSVIGLVAEYLWFMLIFPAAFVLGSIRGDQLENIDNSPMGKWEVLCLAAAMVAFVIGDVVNFSFEEPPLQFLFFFIAGLSLAGSEDSSEHRTSKGKIIFAAVGIGAYIYFLMVPGIQGENAAMAKYGAERTFAKLARQYPYDGHLAAKAGEAKITGARSIEDVKEGLGWFREAAKRVDANGQFYRESGQTEVMLANMEPAEWETHYRAAEEAMEKARARSPRSKTLAMSLGLLYARHFEKLGDKSLAEKARGNLEEAMILDKAIPKESLRHFSSSQKAEIEKAIKKCEK
jgi:O-antigen ligase